MVLNIEYNYVDMNLDLFGSVETNNEGRISARKRANKLVTRGGLSHIDYEMAGGGMVYYIWFGGGDGWWGRFN